MPARRTLIAGATGFVGGRLARALTGSGPVRCLVRDRARAARLEVLGAELRVADVTDAASLAGAGEGIDVAHCLVHAMSGGWSIWAGSARSRSPSTRAAATRPSSSSPTRGPADLLPGGDGGRCRQ